MRIRYLLLICALLLSPLHGVPPAQVKIKKTDPYKDVGLATSEAAFQSLSQSMILWGVGLAAGITIIALLVKTSSASSSNNGGGSSSHSHTHAH